MFTLLSGLCCEDYSEKYCKAHDTVPGIEPSAWRLVTIVISREFSLCQLRRIPGSWPFSPLKLPCLFSTISQLTSSVRNIRIVTDSKTSKGSLSFFILVRNLRHLPRIQVQGHLFSLHLEGIQHYCLGSGESQQRMMWAFLSKHVSKLVPAPCASLASYL